MDDIDAYIARFPEEVQDRLDKLRQLIRACAPDAEEKLAYGMPGYKTHGRPLVYFAGYPRHVGLYATPSGHARFMDALSVYKQGKGSVQFPLDQPMPYELIEQIVRFRVAENKQKALK